MDQHVNLLCRSVFLELRRLGHHRRHISVDATKKLVSSFVLSRPDYCNSLLADLPQNRLGRLQRVQKNAARLVLGRRGRNNRSIGCQSELGSSTRFAACAIVTQIYLLLPTCLIFSLSTFPLCCANAGLMTVPRIKLNKYGKRFFSYIGPVTWNSVPKSVLDAPSLSSFKSNLKRFLLKRKKGVVQNR